MDKVGTSATSSGSGAVLAWLLASYLAPPMLWLAFGLYLEIWSVEGLLRIMLSGWIWGYVGVVVGVLVIVARFHLGRIGKAISEADRRTQEAAAKSIRFLPRFSVLWMGIYCTVGPQIALMGQTLHDPFLDVWGYWLAEFLGIPLILLFTVPFFIMMTMSLERYAKPLALDHDHRFLTLRGKMILSFVYNIIGAVLTLGVAALALSHSGNSTPDAMLTRLLVTGVIVALVSIGNLILMIRQIVGPIEKLSMILSELFAAFAQGTADLGQRAEVESRDEIGYLTEYFNSFLVRLSSLVRAIQQSVSSAVEEHERLLATSNRMRTDMDGLAGGSEFLGSRFAELSSQVSLAKKNSTAMSETVEATAVRIEVQGRDIDDGSKRMGDMAASIASVSSTASRGEKEAAELALLARKGGEDLSVLMQGITSVERSAEAIKKAVGIIREIGERTNLLAMNASIEAAHAGDSGRGFAVVAMEIRKLAETSQRSVEEISGSLTAMVSSVAEARDHAKRNGQSFERLSTSIGQVCEVLGSMKGILDELSAEGRDVASLLERTAASSLGLTSEAKAMTDLVRPIATTLAGMEDLSGATSRRMEDALGRVGTLGKALQEIVEDGRASAEEGRRLQELVHSLKT